MLAAIQFDGETKGRAIEIENVLTGRMLSSKVCTELPIAQLLPEPHFDVREIASGRPSACRLDRCAIEPRSVDPHPVRFANRPPPFRGRWSLRLGRRGLEHHLPFTAFTIFCAASSRSSAEVTLRFDFCDDLLAYSRHWCLRGAPPVARCRPTSFTAATTPSAMTSHFMMPPKMLTKMPFTFGSDMMILNAAVTFSVVALPPTSRKFAGASHRA